MASAQFQDFLILFMPFERESFVPIRTFSTFVCTLMGSKIPTAKGEVQIQRFSFECR